jgi:hypothetical protein
VLIQLKRIIFPIRKNETLIVKNKLVIVTLVFVFCFLSRLLFVNSNVFFFDGDEAIVALMGLDILDGNFPLYFYGQNYGLSIVEALLISFGIILFGIIVF